MRSFVFIRTIIRIRFIGQEYLLGIQLGSSGKYIQDNREKEFKNHITVSKLVFKNEKDRGFPRV